jgi:tetratricopeptide (TPR) repeat protein
MEDTTLRDEVRAAEADIAAGRPEQALTRCQEMQARFPRALIVQRLLGETYLAMHKPREALGALERALEGDPEDARACCARALIHQIHGDSSAALAWYRRACEIRPEDATLRDAYRQLAASLGQPSYRPTSVGLARLYMRGDLFVHAEREWETILAQQPDRLDAQVGLAETLWRAGKREQADEVARHVLNNIRSCVKAMLIVAALEHAAGRSGEAEQLLQRAAELDPERRIGRALYADIFAAGDTALQALLLGTVPGAPAGPVERGRATGGAPVALADTPTTHMPAAGAPAQSTAPGSAGTGSPVPGLPAAAQADLREVNAFAQSRVTAIPRDFHQIFAETEFMIWSREQEEAQARGALAAGPQDSGEPGQPAEFPASADSAPPLERSRTDRFERSTVIVPPALAGSEGAMDDTEARAAIGWVRWLQAQGARPIDGAGRPAVTRPAGGTGPLWPGGGTGPLRPAGGTGPLPPPTRESLRQMFAQLDTAGPGPHVVDADPTPHAAGVSRSGPSGTLDAAATASSLSADGGSTGASVEPVVSRGGKAGRLRDPKAAFADSEPYWTEPPAQTPAPPARPEASDEDGAQNAERHGLAEGQPAAAPLDVGAEPDGRTGGTSASALSAEMQDEDASIHLAEGAPPDPLAVGAPGPRDELGPAQDESPDSELPGGDTYLGRIRLARRKRAQGRAEEALVEYRGILRDSPETLDDLIHDLRDMVTETENPEVHRLLGDAYIREGDYLRALESYNRALALTQSQES